MDITPNRQPRRNATHDAGVATKFCSKVDTHGGNVFQGVISSGRDTVIHQGPSIQDIQEILRGFVKEIRSKEPDVTLGADFLENCSSVASFQTARSFSSEDSHSWRLLRRELYSKGITPVIFRHHRTQIVKIFTEAVNESLFAENDAPVHDIRNVLQPDFLEIVDNEDDASSISTTREILANDPKTKQEINSSHRESNPYCDEEVDNILEDDSLYNESQIKIVDRRYYLTKALFDTFGNQNALQRATDTGAHDSVVALLQTGADASQISLCTATIRNDEKMVGLMVRAGADLTKRNKDGRTALFLAARNRHTKIARFLLKKGASVHNNCLEMDKEGSLLYMAITRTNVAFVSELLDAGTNPNLRDDTSVSLLFAVLAVGSNAMTETLLAAGLRADKLDKFGRNALHQLSLESTIPTIEALLNAGASLDTVDKYGRSVLYSACLRASHEVVAYLLDSVSQLETYDRDGRTPLLATTEDLCSQAVRHLFQNGQYHELNENTFNSVQVRKSARVFQERMKIIHLLLSRGADVTKATNTGLTPLHFAAIAGCTELVDALIQNGAKVDAKDSRRRTPLCYAVWAGEHQTIDFLISRGANVNENEVVFVTLDMVLPESSRWTHPDSFVVIHDLSFSAGTPKPFKPTHPVKISKFKHNPKGLQTLDFLLSRSPGLISTHKMHVKLRLRAEYYIHPLLYAAKVGYMDLLECLLRHGISTETRSLSGWTALHFAAERGHNNIVQRLLAAGAHVNAINQFGESPLHFAADSHCLRQDDLYDPPYSACLKSNKYLTMSTLLSHGAASVIFSYAGSSPWDLAILDPQSVATDILMIYRAKRRITKTSYVNVQEERDDWEHVRYYNEGSLKMSTQALDLAGGLTGSLKKKMKSNDAEAGPSCSTGDRGSRRNST